ncbi:MAG: protein jag [bacterium]|nr:protein jag [bacterium]MDD4152339.1 protein jag [bacterium]MDD4557534.1 protein jag [bacterium]
MRSIEQTGKTVDEAIQAALEALGVSREEITVEVLDEPVKGMFGLGTKEARIKVSTKDGEEETFGGASAEDHRKAKECFEQVISRMGLAAKVESWDEDGYIHLNAEGQDMGILIGRQGQTLDALQFIINLILNKNREERIRVILDAEFYRERRKKLLANMAEKMAARAIETGQEAVLSAMTPFERRVIHTTLQGNEHVITFSEGEEPYRRVVIQPR